MALVADCVDDLQFPPVLPLCCGAVACTLVQERVDRCTFYAKEEEL